MKATLTTPPPPRSTPATRAANTSHNPYTPPFTIIVDTREQAPFSFRYKSDRSKHNYAVLSPRIEKQGLKTGDYSIKGYTDRVTIERKSLSDLFGSLGGKDGCNRDRFQAEHLRMLQDFVWWGGIAHVVIEGSRADVRSFPDQQTSGGVWRGVNPNAVLSASIDWPREFRVPWHWAGSRDEAERLTFDLLEDAWETFEEERKAVEREARNKQIEVLKNVNANK